MLVTISRLFPRASVARLAFDDLVQAGVSHDDISVVTTQDGAAVLEHAAPQAGEGAGTGASIGGVIGGTGGLLAGLGIIAVPGLGPLVAAGWLAATAAGVVAGAAAGGLVGALLELGMSREEAELYLDGVKRGDTLVTVRVDDAHEQEVRAILDTHAPDGLAPVPGLDIDEPSLSGARATTTATREDADRFTAPPLA